MKFKVGDTVQRVRGCSHGSYKIGDIGEVIFVRTSDNNVKLSGDERDYYHDPKNLELVSRREEIINNYPIY